MYTLQMYTNFPYFQLFPDFFCNIHLPRHSASKKSPTVSFRFNVSGHRKCICLHTGTASAHLSVEHPSASGMSMTEIMNGTTHRCHRNWKMTGNVYVTLTGLPRCIPGSHLGDRETTLTASLSSDGSTPRRTFTLVTLPSVSTVN